ncbi:Ectonucleotide pyrophosphatase/phosphodiesterase 1 [Nakaseomyces bracarensis]|uniref:Ectonucleotide pyrophosphatase/phosphodiesterase 1 n=1 Tax=Nakaseomyces bracarensis TaxID=273131 RepID=A0ABR4NYW3_9SACH
MAKASNDVHDTVHEVEDEVIPSGIGDIPVPGLAEVGDEEKQVPWYARYFVNKMREKELAGIPLYELDTEGRLRPIENGGEEDRWFSDTTNEWFDSHKHFSFTAKRKRHTLILGLIIVILMLTLRIFNHDSVHNPELDRHHQYTNYDPYITYNNGTHEFNPLNIIISLNGLSSRLITQEKMPFLHKLFSRDYDETLDQNITVSSHLQPQFPLQSIPNMWTLVTGLYPAQHGMVANTFWDTENELEFRPGIVEPKVWVDNGEPIWETVQKAYNHDKKWEYKVYSNMWPGSDVNYTSLGKVNPARQPYYMDLYDAKETIEDKLQKIFHYLDIADITERPQMILSAINDIDAFGHQHGYPMDRNHFYGEKFHKILNKVDQFVNDTYTGLRERNVTGFTNVIIVSNHGMADTKFPENVTIWEELIHEERDYLRDNDMISHVYMEGSSLGIYVTSNSQISEVYKIIKNRIDNQRFSVYLNGNLPKEWNYNINKGYNEKSPSNSKNGKESGPLPGNAGGEDQLSSGKSIGERGLIHKQRRDTIVNENSAALKNGAKQKSSIIPREPTIWIVPQLGNSIMLKEKYDIVAKRLKKNKKNAEEFYIGSHNLANIEHPDLQAVFAGTGPFFHDKEIGVISNLDIYNLLCDINGISIRDRNPNNGTTRPLF